MPQSNRPFELYDNVPDGAILEIWVTGDAGDFVSNAVIDETISDADGLLTHSQLYRANGTQTAGAWTLHSLHSYVVKIRTKFNLQADKKATIYTRIVHNGQPVAPEWFWKIKGNSSSRPDPVGLFVLMVQPAAPAAAPNNITNA